MIAALLAATALAVPAAHDWTRFGYDAARSSASPYATGITASNAGQLQRQRVELGGTADSSPIFLHDVEVAGARRDVFFLTTSYGRTVAADAATGRILWRYTPPGYASLAGTYRIANATPVADPGRRFLYAAGPDGRIRKLAVADGHQVWSRAITLLPRREKIAPSLNFARGLVIATTGGYVGDEPPYQGHVVTLRAGSGAIVHVWNSLCSDRHRLIQPNSCRSSDSAIWGRAGAVVEPGSGR
ncbi:MAG TPA: PQQ-binding-like beta-propeller repeat protein, partial [Gaiellaceae bacterium]|nr:PQQ-binding-like beta-propeller repeat protein [Gaiellaceae bacterium]